MGLEGGAVTTSVIEAASLEEEAGDEVGVGMVIQLEIGEIESTMSIGFVDFLIDEISQNTSIYGTIGLSIYHFHFTPMTRA